MPAPSSMFMGGASNRLVRDAALSESDRRQQRSQAQLDVARSVVRGALDIDSRRQDAYAGVTPEAPEALDAADKWSAVNALRDLYAD